MSINVISVQVNKTSAAVAGQTWNLPTTMSYLQMQSPCDIWRDMWALDKLTMSSGHRQPDLPCPVSRVLPTLATALDPVIAPQSHQSVPQWCHNRAGLRFPTALPRHGPHWAPHPWEPWSPWCPDMSMHGGTSPDHVFSLQGFCVSKTFSEQFQSHRAGNKEQRLYLEGMRPLGGSS